MSLEDGSGVVGTQAEGLTKGAGRTTAGGSSDVAGEKELRSRVVRALQDLDDDHRAVVVLRDIEGFDYREISEVLGIPPGTVKSRLHRARMSLRSAIQPVISRDV